MGTNFEDLIARGLHSARPAAGIPGRLYHETDTDEVYRDNGSTWQLFAVTAGGSGTDADAVHVNVADEIHGIDLKATPASTDVVIIEDSADSWNKKRTPVSALTGGGSAPNRAAFVYKAALLEPLAIEALQVGSFSYAIGAGDPRYVVASFNTQLGGAGRWEQRSPFHPTILNGVTLAGLGSSAAAIILDPGLPTYTDAEATYYARLNAIPGLATKYFYIGNETKVFLPGPYGNLITSVNVYDNTWLVPRPWGTSIGWNLWDEISDSSTWRIGDGLLLPIAKQCLSRISSQGTGSLTYLILPSTWGAVVDPNTYLFRDDFMGATLDDSTVWHRAQNTAGNIEIDTDWQWCKFIGNGSWGANSLYGRTSITRATGRALIVDVCINGEGGMVGWSNGGGYSYTYLSHALNFNTNAIHAFENSTDRGAVGSGFTAGAIYRVRITLNVSGAATYEIQGGPEYAALGGATWTDITPGTTSSADNTLYAGCAAYGTGPNWISDPKIY